MWVSKAVYEDLQEENGRLRREANGLDDLLARARVMSFKGETGILVADRCYLVLKDVYDDIFKRLATAEDNVRTLTAERDWYKNAFAEQRCLATLAEKEIEENVNKS